MDIKTKTVTLTAPTREEIAAHVLEPGDCCWLLDMSAPDPLKVAPLGWGVVVKSASNTDKEIDVRIGEKPIQLYARNHLWWMGPM